MMHIGDKIKLFREKRGFSQAQMAELLNMSVQGYGNIERGDTDLSFSRLELISKELGVKPEQIVGFGEQNNFVNSNNNQNYTYQNFTDKDLTHALEKSQQEVTFLKEKISLLEATITDLRNTVAVLQREK
jgi:transcriptional regulator with XRE-family HTH domain